MNWSSVYDSQKADLADALAHQQVMNNQQMQVASAVSQRQQADRSFGLQEKTLAENTKYREMQQKGLDDDRKARADDRQETIDRQAATARVANLEKLMASKRKGDAVGAVDQARLANEGFTGFATGAGADNHMTEPHFHVANNTALDTADAKEKGAADKAASDLAHQQHAEKNDDVRTKAAMISAMKPSGGAAAGGASGLTPDGVDYLSTQYRLLGANGIPTRISEGDRVRIVNGAAQQGKVLGQTPAAIVQRQAAFKSDSASLSQITKMADAASSYETKAQAQAQMVLNLSSKLGRSSIPLLNNYLLAGKANIGGDPATAEYFNAIATFSTEYAKIMEGSTGSVAASTEGSRKMTERLINASQTPEQISKTVALMQWEMQQTLNGYQATIDHIQQRQMGGAASTTAAPGNTTTPVQPTPTQNTDSAARAAALLKKYGGGQ